MYSRCRNSLREVAEATCSVHLADFLVCLIQMSGKFGGRWPGDRWCRGRWIGVVKGRWRGVVKSRWRGVVERCGEGQVER